MMKNMKLKIIKFPKDLGHLHKDFVFYHITVGINNKSNGSSRSHNMLNSVSHIYIYISQNNPMSMCCYTC